MEYTQEELKRLQQVSLEMAEYLVGFCRSHGLLCYFCGGGCIGAVRHRGFIPWDDDLDFFMPRKDYEKLWELWRQEGDDQRFCLAKPGPAYHDHNAFMTLRDRRTTLIKPYQADLDIVHGVAIDIFPLDGYPDKRWQRCLQCMWACIYSLYCSQVVPEKHGKVIELAGRLCLAAVPSKRLRYRIWHFAERQMRRYPIARCGGVTELCAGPGYMRNWYPKEAFSKAVMWPFEGRRMPIPVGYDIYLRTAFGDYMQLPKEADRKPTHDVAFVDLERSYKTYKGRYYCVDRKRSGCSILNMP